MKRTQITVLVACCCTFLVGQQHIKMGAPQPLRDFDLKQFANQLPQRALNKHWEREKSDISSLPEDPLQHLAFPANDLLLLYSTDYVQTSPRRTLDALVFNLENGTLQSRERWPSLPRRGLNDLEDTESRIIPVHNGNFLVHAGGKLLLYSRNLKLLQERELPLDTADPSETWAASVPPGGSLVYLHHWASRHRELQDEWHDADSLKTYTPSI